MTQSPSDLRKSPGIPISKHPARNDPPKALPQIHTTFFSLEPAASYWPRCKRFNLETKSMRFGEALFWGNDPVGSLSAKLRINAIHPMPIQCASSHPEAQSLLSIVSTTTTWSMGNWGCSTSYKQTQTKQSFKSSFVPLRGAMLATLSGICFLESWLE